MFHTRMFGRIVLDSVRHGDSLAGRLHESVPHHYHFSAELYPITVAQHWIG